MTINSSTRIAGPYTGNGSTTAFPFSFKVFTTADVTVVQTDLSSVETTLVMGTSYTVSLNANQNSTPGGTVTMLTAPATGYKITLTSSLSYTQTLDLTNQGGFYPSTINDALDRATIQIQQLNEQVGRAAKVNISSGVDSTTLVNNVNTVAANLSTIQAVNSNSTNINAVNANSTNINTVAGNNANITTVAANNTNVSTVAGVSANVTTVANNIGSVNTVSGNTTNINTVASANTNVSTVATNIASVNTSATNITAIQNAAANASSAASSASAASTSATNAASSASAASSSAAAAAASAASGLYRQVLDKSANYAIVAADGGSLFRITTTSAAITLTLPQISTVTDGFKVSIVKWTSDANAVNINRSGSDTINGGTTVQIGSQYSQIILVADYETNQWFASLSGLGATNVNVDVFTGNGVTTAFTLSGDPGSKNNTIVEISGVYQQKSTYSVTGTTLTFSTAPPTGASNVEVVWTTPLAIGTPSDGTVTTTKLAGGFTLPVNQGGTGTTSTTFTNLTTNVTGTLPVANGGTGAATLTGYGAVVMNSAGTAATSVAPSTSGNLLTSNGTSWVSSAAPAGGVTSAVAGNGITVSGATGAVTISQDFYTGSSATNLSLPVGSYVIYFAPTASSVNTSIAPKLGSFITANDSYSASGTGGTLSGTWRTRGIFGTFCSNGYLLQRTA